MDCNQLKCSKKSKNTIACNRTEHDSLSDACRLPGLITSLMQDVIDARQPRSSLYSYTYLPFLSVCR